MRISCFAKNVNTRYTIVWYKVRNVCTITKWLEKLCWTGNKIHGLGFRIHALFVYVVYKWENAVCKKSAGVFALCHSKIILRGLEIRADWRDYRTGLHAAISGNRAVNMMPRGSGASTEILMIPGAGEEFEFWRIN